MVDLGLLRNDERLIAFRRSSVKYLHITTNFLGSLGSTIFYFEYRREPNATSPLTTTTGGEVFIRACDDVFIHSKDIIQRKRGLVNPPLGIKP